MIAAARDFLTEIKFEHTLFALPFAYVAALLAAHGVPQLRILVWITLAVVGARTAAMAANRLLDARLDAKNPRTARRLLASGRLAPAVMIWACIAGLALLALAAARLNPLCLILLPVGALAVLIYPLVKRWTWGVHFVLGAVDALAPLGAWIAVTGKFEPGAVLLFVAVTLWVAGFDVLYALMDRDFDVRENVRSIPARFGSAAGRRLPQVLHVLVVLALGVLGLVAAVRPLYWLGVFFAAVLVVYELRLIARQSDFSALNHAIFNANMLFSVAFFLSTAASVFSA
ncbi:MAG: putative 4-hydroxybenzoate polyprenyltransferase [Candidatus Eremiobacteraeota bacterium]|nr:putative 4-hydroxybenzoate polyprenyltransferase [Candidatus Eremiobacteraeota bacterium]